MKVEVIVDREAFERKQFKAQGGFNPINKAFEGQLEKIWEAINQALWEDAS